MAVVLPFDENAHFAPGLRRSHSQPKFSSKQSNFRQSASTSHLSDAYQPSQNSWSQHTRRSREPSPSDATSQEPNSPSQAYQKIPVFFSDSSTTSSSTSSPRLSPSVASTHAASPTKLLVPSLRLPQRLGRPGYGSSPIGTDDGADADADAAIHIDYSHYDGVSYFDPTKDYATPHGLQDMGEAYVPSPNDNTVSSTALSRTDSSEFDVYQHAAEDDTAIRAMPSRHVDYLSHNWREEDIWESWKYIVSRRGDYSNSARLENASWRTWMKSKNKLKTVSPETLNWLKDCDVTWLYGPLQTGHESFVRTGRATDSVELTKSNSFLSSHKKPILKKRSMSEIMLQRSISASSLIKQAAAAVQAQQKDSGVRRTARPRLDRSITDYVTFPFSSRPFSGAASCLQSVSGRSSGLISPSERKHIHFNEQVEQCIAVDAKGDDDVDEDEVPAAYDSDSDDGAIMMKRGASKHRMQPRRRHSYMGYTEAKTTIAMLPSTTLKYRDEPTDSPDDPAPAGSAMKHSYRSPALSPSSSQETLRPSRPSGRLFVTGDDEDDEDDEDEDEGFQFGSHHTAPPMRDNGDGSDADEDNDEDDDGLGMSMGASRRRSTGGLVSSASTSRLGSLRVTTTSRSSLHAQSLFAGSSAGSGGGGLKRTTSTSSISTSDPAGMRRTASGMFMPFDEGEPAADGGNGGVLSRIVDTINTARDIVHVVWNVGWRN